MKITIKTLREATKETFTDTAFMIGLGWAAAVCHIVFFCFIAWLLVFMGNKGMQLLFLETTRGAYGVATILPSLCFLLYFQQRFGSLDFKVFETHPLFK